MNAYRLLFFLTLLNLLNFVDRQLIASFANFIVPDLGLTDTQYGFLTTVPFIVFYSIAGLFMGVLADMVNRPKLIAFGVVLWSVFTALTGAAKGFVSMAVPRMFIGVGESILTPTSMSLLSDSFPPKRMGFAAGFYYMGVPIGVGVSLLIAGYLGESLGWRNCFYLLGFIGLLAAIVQGGLIRVIIPKLGNIKSVYFGMVFYILGLILISLAQESWMIFAFAIPLSLGGISGPALQGIMTNNIPDDEQGEFQGGMTSLISLTAIIGPLLMTNLFSYFTSESTYFYFPGAPFMLGAVLSIFGLVIAIKFLSGSKIKY